MKRVLFSLVSILLLVAPAWAGLDEGRAAYERGDYLAALREWKPLAEQGLASAQYNLGSLYGNGQGVRQDLGEAAKWYRRAAQQGHAEAQILLGISHSKGLGVPEDLVQAYMWYTLAAAASPPGDLRSRVIRLRDILAKDMTADQEAKAEQLAQAWTPKGE
jgi:TPR repeat protein